MKILLFGGAGQLGSEFTFRARDLNFEVFSPAIGEVDITEETQVRYLASKIKPNVVLNFAAYTNVDKAESEQDLAFKINRDGAAFVAHAAKDVGARLIHVSTDYVFGGTGSVPLTETDPVGPINVYGRSKLAGEEEVMKVLPKHSLIVRTSSLHGQYGANFVHTMLSLFKDKKTVRVVSDQIMSPTWAGFLSEVILDLCRIPVSGVIHCSCKGAISWYEFAQAIAKKGFPGEAVEVVPIPVTELDRPAKRPLYSCFDLTKLESVIGRQAISWEQGLAFHLKDLEAAKKKGKE